MSCLFATPDSISLEAVGHSLCVAVFAAGADFCAAGDRVPGGFGPFDFAFCGHDLL